MSERLNQSAIGGQSELERKHGESIMTDDVPTGHPRSLIDGSVPAVSVNVDTHTNIADHVYNDRTDSV